MVYLKLNLPEEKVNYNEFGLLTSKPVAHTPERIKGIRLSVEITGFVSPTDFFAFNLYCPDKAMTTNEQLTVLRGLGFKTVPFELYTNNINAMINTKARFSEYGAKWWDVTKNEEFVTPSITTIKDISWAIDGLQRLVRVLDTDEGKFSVLDHRGQESYQRGLKVKVNGDAVEPFMSGTIVDSTPSHCPKCNNPLKSYQMASDLPLIIKCVSPFCNQLVVTEEPIAAEVVEEVTVSEETSFRGQATSEVDEFKTFEESVPEPVAEDEPDESNAADLVDEDNTLRIINLEVKSLSVDVENQIQLVEEAPADFILTNSKRSVTSKSRATSKETGIPLLSIKELEEKLNG